MNALLIIAGNEFKRAVRNRWIAATTLLMLALSLSLSLLGSAPTGSVDADRLGITIVSLSSLSIFLIPLIALMLSYDAIVGEIENGTMLLLLTYPVRRWQIVTGKFLGHTAVLTVATVLGYGSSGLAIGLLESNANMETWMAFLMMCVSSILLGMAFVALGYLVSALVRERGTAAGLAVAVWLLFVLLFDMALLGALVADQGQTLKANTVTALMMLNPADIYRMFNLTGSPDIAALAGMAGVGESLRLPSSVLAGSLLMWSLLPIGLAIMAFKRREL